MELFERLLDLINLIWGIALAAVLFFAVVIGVIAALGALGVMHLFGP